MLEDHADGAAQRAQALFIERRDIDAINDHTAGRGLLKAVGEADQRGLARTRAADDAGDGAFRHDVIDTGKGCEAGLAVGAAKGLGHAFKRDHRLLCRPFRDRLF
ncbi:hypothetical protein D3C86_1816060 [compost metagenome]